MKACRIKTDAGGLFCLVLRAAFELLMSKWHYFNFFMHHDNVMPMCHSCMVCCKGLPFLNVPNVINNHEDLLYSKSLRCSCGAVLAAADDAAAAFFFPAHVVLLEMSANCIAAWLTSHLIYSNTNSGIGSNSP